MTRLATPPPPLVTRSITIIIVCCVVILKASSPSATSRIGLTIDDFNSIFSSDIAHEDFAIRHDNIDDDDAGARPHHRRTLSGVTEWDHDLWDTRTATEWRSAHRRHLLLRTTTTTSVTTPPAARLDPYVVCDTRYRSPGYDARTLLEKYFRESGVIKSLYNRDDKTCYLLTASVEVAANASEDLVVQPLLPAMKWREGTREMVEKVKEGGRVKVSFCPGVDGREGAAVFETGEVTNEESEECSTLFSKAVTTVSSTGTTLTVNLLPENTTDTDDTGLERLSKCTLSLLTDLTSRRDICSVGLVPSLKLFNVEAQWIVQSGVKDERPFFDAGLTGKGQVVACSDTGIDLDNCYFREANLRRGRSNLSNNRKVIQYIDHGDSSDYTGGHGTHVAGTIVGRRYSGRGEVNGDADGIARDAKLAFFDVHRAGKHELEVPEDDVPGLFDPGYKVGARIHSVSWGSPYNFYGELDSEFDEYAFQHPNFVIVTAAGNTGKDWDNTDVKNSVSSPGTAKNVITVGASQSSGKDLNNGMLGPSYLADFSSRGPTADGRTKPEIVAPGYNILSAKAQPFKRGECDGSEGTMEMAGTSMAVPVVSGTAALVRQYFEEGRYPSGKQTDSDSLDPSGALVKAVMINGARYMKGVQNEKQITNIMPYDNNQNFGRLSLIDSLPLKKSKKGEYSLFIMDQTSIRNREIHDYEFTTTRASSTGCDAKEVSVSLVWTDPASVPGCQQCVLNDLDLEVEVEENKRKRTLYPNGLSKRDSTNNAERIRMLLPYTTQRGDSKFTVLVKGYDLDTKSQDYALVVTGCFERPGAEKTGNNSFRSGTVSETEDSISHSSTKTRVSESSEDSVTIAEGSDDTSESSSNTDSSESSSETRISKSSEDSVTIAEGSDDTSMAAESDDRDDNIMADPSDGPMTDDSDDGIVMDTPEQSPPTPLSIGTDLTGRYQHEGYMFEIVALNTVHITSLSIHLNTNSPITVEVYTKQHEMRNSLNRESDWTYIQSITVTGQGRGQHTPLPTFDQEIVAEKGSVQAFYVTLRDPFMLTSRGGQYGTKAVDNEDIRLLTGVAKTYKFSRTFSRWQWNGRVHYYKR